MPSDESAPPPFDVAAGAFLASWDDSERVFDRARAEQEARDA